MRTRITVAILGSVVAALVLTGLGTLVLDRLGARAATEAELRDQAEGLATLTAPTVDRQSGVPAPRARPGAAGLRARRASTSCSSTGRAGSRARPPRGIGADHFDTGPPARRRDLERPRRSDRLRAGPRSGGPGRARRRPHPLGRPRTGPGVPVVRALGRAHPRRRGRRRGPAQPGPHRPPPGGRRGHPPDRRRRPEHAAGCAARRSPGRAQRPHPLDQHDGRGPRAVAGARAAVPALGVARPADPSRPPSAGTPRPSATAGSNPSRRPGSSCRRRSDSSGWWPTSSTWLASTPVGSASTCARPTSVGSSPRPWRASGRRRSGRGVVLDLEDGGAGTCAVVDPDRLGQVVANLLDNGCRHAVGRVRVTRRRRRRHDRRGRRGRRGRHRPGGPAPRLRTALRQPAPAAPTGVGLGPGARHRARAGGGDGRRGVGRVADRARRGGTRLSVRLPTVRLSAGSPAGPPPAAVTAAGGVTDRLT